MAANMAAHAQGNAPARGRSPRRLAARAAGVAVTAIAALLCVWLFVLPVVVVALSSVASHWSGTILPDGFSTRWFERLGSSDFDAVVASLEVGFGVAVSGTALGLWLALGLEGRRRHGLAPWRCCARSAFPARSSASTTIRTSSPAACGSAW